MYFLICERQIFFNFVMAAESAPVNFLHLFILFFLNQIVSGSALVWSYYAVRFPTTNDYGTLKIGVMLL